MRAAAGGDGLFEEEHPNAGRIFADRVNESAAFENSLLAFRAMLTQGEYLDGRARNVLNFYGMGGIGKSRLGERLQTWVSGALGDDTEWGARPDVAVTATMKIDLWPSGGLVDVEDIVLQIRNALNAHKRSWAAFDLALMAYWDAVHPGASLADHPALGAQTRGSIRDTASSVLSDLGIPFAGTLTTLTLQAVDAISERLREQAAERSGSQLHPRLGDFLRECAETPSPTDPRPELLVRAAHLLALEMAQGPTETTPLLVVFVDTFERLRKDTRRTGERHLSMLIRKMPNVLFVVLGRHRVRWNELDCASADAPGPRAWPCLDPSSPVEPRPHMVGNLSMTDRLVLLDLAEERYGLELGTVVKELLATSSEGLPQYIDLALSRAISLQENEMGRLTVGDVKATLPELVTKVMEDVPDDERRAIRAAAMFRFFDAELVAAAAGVDTGVAQRAMTRPMISSTGRGDSTYRMHDAVREAICSVTAGHPDGWSPSDWNRAASSAAALLRGRYSTALRSHEYSAALDALARAVETVCSHTPQLEAATVPTYANWLVRAVVNCPSPRGLATRVPLNAAEEYGKDLVEYTLARARLLSGPDRRSVLRRLFESNGHLAAASGRALGYDLRAQMLFDEAIDVFGKLTEHHSSQMHLYQQCLTVSMARRFSTAHALAQGLEEDRKQMLRAGTELHLGTPGLYFSRVPQRLSQLAEEGKPREIIDTRGNAFLWGSIFSQDVTLDPVQQLYQEATAIGHTTAMRDCLAALVLRAPLDPRADAWLRELDRLDRSTHEGRPGYRSALARAVIAYGRRDRVALQELAETVDRAWSHRSRSWIAVESIINAGGARLAPSPAQWPEPVEHIMGRWERSAEGLRPRFAT